MWRFLMGIGMALHKLARPRPPRPDFKKWVDATVSPRPGKFKLNFYVPKEWKVVNKAQGTRRFPVVVNFHGGTYSQRLVNDKVALCGEMIDGWADSMIDRWIYIGQGDG